MKNLRCFSGLGNSASVAMMLSEAMPEDFADHVWVFPVYAWGVPPIVIKALKHTDFRGEYVHMVCTCGSETGHIDRQWRRLVTERNGIAGGIYSVVMPLSYVCMPFMNVDPKDKEARKLAAAPGRVQTIAACIQARQQTVDLTLGPCPGFLSRVVYPWFFNTLMRATKWHVSNSCTGCGLCASQCPNQNITLVNGRPQWGADCTYCLRCYHGCRRHAVAYWRFTRHKGQYLHPDFKQVIKFSEK
ncbi:MAG: EFR1 family ferrodoxin [Bacteroides sp.]|nr:EFR1 family ferrodoxin [Bacteroides sp.]MCM1380176.1 EFR1 family ferrodoxin [Bacteroides sp.]MCM1446475.1 EFR1 family ferrodoxin [Prevotella sp.]